MNKRIIEDNFNLKVFDISNLDKHFGTELYLINTDVGKYIVKVLPLYMENVKYEGELAEYLYSRNINVARFLKSKDDTYVVKTPEFQFTIQQFIEGESLSVNTAPDWFVSKSADFLGQTALLLKDYEGLSFALERNSFQLKRFAEKCGNIKKNLLRRKK